MLTMFVFVSGFSLALILCGWAFLLGLLLLLHAYYASERLHDGDEDP
jgi:hypothetical protein